MSAIRRIRKTDNNRIARVCGATIVSRPDELQESDIGTGCGLFEIRKFGDEYVRLGRGVQQTVALESFLVFPGSPLSSPLSPCPRVFWDWGGPL